MDIELHEHLMRVTVDTFKKETDKLKYENQRLRDKLHAESESRNKRADELTILYADINKMKEELAKEKDRATALDNETHQLAQELSERSNANDGLLLAKVMAVADRDHYKDRLAKCEKRGAKESAEFFAMRDSLILNGFSQTETGEWQPPLRKRPDIEGADLIKAAIEMFRASAVVQQAVQKYNAANPA
jgi:regulator of replication initiation timing